jgi:type VI secretion system VasD/TssJ family lipoprotein
MIRQPRREAMRLSHARSIRTAVTVVLLSGAVSLLGGCCTANLMLRKCPAQIDLRVTAADQLNSCADQGSFQVMVRIYSLTAPGAFQAAEFEQLWFEESNLGGAVVDVLKLTVAPGGAQSQRWQRPDGVRAIGVVANFCRLDAGCWKQVLELGDGTQRIDLNLSGTCLTLAARP